MTLIILLEACATSPIDIALQNDLSSLPPRIALADVPFFPQRDYQCGPAALAMVLAYRQVPVVPDDLVKQIYLPERKGSLTPEIIAAVRRYEFVPYVFTSGMHDLLVELAAGNPVLVMQNLGLSWYPAWHYSVVIGYDIDKRHFISRSGEDAERITTFRNFENTWSRAGHWALVVPDQERLPATVDMLPWLQGAEDLSATGHSFGAHRAYVLASIKWPDSDVVWFALGNSFYQQQKAIDAEQAYRRSLDLKRDNPKVLNNLAYALSEQGCQRQAIRAANCAAIQAPQDANIRQTLQEVRGKSFSSRQSLQCNTVDYCSVVAKGVLSKQ